MGKGPKKSPHSFLSFWWATLWVARKGAWADFGHFANLGVLIFGLWLLVAVLFVGSSWVMAKLKRITEEQVNHWTLIIPVILFLVAFAVRCFYGAYRLYRDAEDARQKESACHVEEIEKISSAHVREIQADKSTIETQLENIGILKKQLDDREFKQTIRNELGRKLIALQNRTYAIGQISPYLYNGQVKEDQTTESFALLNDIANYISTNCGNAEMGIFTSLANLTYRPVDHLGWHETDVSLKEKIRIVDRLAHHEKNLLEIINGYK